MSEALKRMNLCFDLDGPIIDVCDRYYRAYLESLAGSEIKSEQILKKEDFWKLKQNRVSDLEISILSGQNIQDSKNSGDLRKALSFKTDYLALDKIFDDVYKTFDYLKSQSINFFIVTLRRRSQLDYAIKQFKLNKYLSNEKFFSRTDDQKSQNDIQEKYLLFASAINLLSLNPIETWMIGDSETDIHSARLVRFGKIISITRGIRSKEQLAVLRPDYLVSNLSEVVDLTMSVKAR